MDATSAPSHHPPVPSDAPLTPEPEGSPHRLHQWRFVVLFALILTSHIMLPLLREIRFLNAISGLIFMTVLGLAGWLSIVTPRLRTAYVVALGVGLISTATQLTGESVVTPVIWASYHAGLFLITTASLIEWVSTQTRVTTDTIFAALSGFYLLGFAFALVYTAIELSYPGSFNSSFDTLFDFFYFSFVTLTTLGFGDIAPIRPLSRALVTTEALLGQIYLVVLVARLVSLRSTPPSESQGG